MKAEAQPLIASKEQLSSDEFEALDFFNENNQAKGIPVLASDDNRSRGIYNFDCFDEIVAKAKELQTTDSDSVLVLPLYLKINIPGTGNKPAKKTIAVSSKLEAL
jgi:hypothetical protein